MHGAATAQGTFDLNALVPEVRNCVNLLVLLSRDTTLFRDLSAETAAVCKGANVW